MVLIIFPFSTSIGLKFDNTNAGYNPEKNTPVTNSTVSPSQKLTLVNKEKEIECLFQFYKKANLHKNNPNNSILFIKHGENYVGFFALNILLTWLNLYPKITN